MKGNLEPEDQQAKSDRSQWLAALMVFMATLALALLLGRAPNPSGPTNDFAFYWTAARQLVCGKSPYSPQQALEFQRRFSFSGKAPLVMLNPPWVLPLIAPFGLLPFSVAKSLWLSIGLALVFISVHWLWDLYGTNENRWIGWLVAGTFLPVGVVLAIGQIGPLVLLGLAGYLRFEGKANDLRAGAFLFFVALKPHLVFLLWAALVLCAIHQRRWKPILAFLLTLAAASLLAIALDHRAFHEYIELLAGKRILLQETATAGGLLRHLSGVQALQLVPAGMATLWFPFYWIRYRFGWEWRYRLPILLLVSITATSYAWFFDQVVLLPAVLYATVLLLRSRAPILLGAVIAYAAVNCFVLLLLVNHRTTFWYAWTGPAWLFLYVAVKLSVTNSGCQQLPLSGGPRPPGEVISDRLFAVSQQLPGNVVI